MVLSTLYKIGDKLEDVVRRLLSKTPLIYAFIGGVGVVLFWRGVWHTADYIMELVSHPTGGNDTLTAMGMPWWDGPLSIVIGSVILLVTGLFVSHFIGNEIIISGLKHEKKIAEKTEQEIDDDLKENEAIKREIHGIDKRLKRIEILLNK